MSHHLNINEEEYSAEALNLFNREREGYIEFALDDLSGGASVESAKKRLETRVMLDMEHILFDYLKDSNVLRTEYHYQYLSESYGRRIRREPRMSDVPSELLDITKVRPDFNIIINSVMTEAGKRKIIADIMSVTEEARK